MDDIVPWRERRVGGLPRSDASSAGLVPRSCSSEARSVEDIERRRIRFGTILISLRWPGMVSLLPLAVLALVLRREVLTLSSETGGQNVLPSIGRWFTTVWNLPIWPGTL